MSTGNTVYSTVALAGRASDPRVGEAMLTLAAHLLERGRHVLAVDGVDIDFGLLPVTRVAEGELAKAADLLVAVGGDGTQAAAVPTTRARIISARFCSPGIRKVAAMAISMP